MAVTDETIIIKNTKIWRRKEDKIRGHKEEQGVYKLFQLHKIHERIREAVKECLERVISTEDIENEFSWE